MGMAFADFHLVIEPGGAAALAAVLTGKVDLVGKTVVAIASGGNVDGATFIRALEISSPLVAPCQSNRWPDHQASVES